MIIEKHVDVDGFLAFVAKRARCRVTAASRCPVMLRAVVRCSLGGVFLASRLRLGQVVSSLRGRDALFGAFVGRGGYLAFRRTATAAPSVAAFSWCYGDRERTICIVAVNGKVVGVSTALRCGGWPYHGVIRLVVGAQRLRQCLAVSYRGNDNGGGHAPLLHSYTGESKERTIGSSFLGSCAWRTGG